VQLEVWTRLVEALPAGLTVSRAAKIFRRSFQVTRRRLLENGYEPRPERKKRVFPTPEWVLKADWKQPNIDIARKHGMCRERVRQWRLKLHKPKVESRGRFKPSKNGK
jgi:hypothetical protein